MGKCSFSAVLGGYLFMELNEVFFNELCLKDKILNYENWKELIQTKNVLKNVGFSVCRLSNSEHTALMNSISALNNPTIKNIFFQFFHTPFETKELDESEEKSSDFLSKEVLYNNVSAYGFSLASYYNTFALSFLTDEKWNLSKIQAECNSESVEIHHISKQEHIKENSEWLETRGEIELITTDLEPSSKNPKFRDDHGKDELETFWKKIRTSEYIVSCINSLPFSSYNRDFIRDVYPDGRIEITLPWTDKGLGLVIQSTGRNRRETEKIAKILEEEYSR